MSPLRQHYQPNIITIDLVKAWIRPLIPSQERLQSGALFWDRTPMAIDWWRRPSPWWRDRRLRLDGYLRKLLIKIIFVASSNVAAMPAISYLLSICLLNTIMVSRKPYFLWPVRRCIRNEEEKACENNAQCRCLIRLVMLMRQYRSSALLYDPPAWRNLHAAYFDNSPAPDRHKPHAARQSRRIHRPT